MYTTASPRRSPWPYVIIASFICLAIFDACIVTLALRTKTAVIEENSYERSLGYDAIIAAKQSALQDGIQHSIRVQDGAVSIDIGGLSATTSYDAVIKILHANDAGKDVIVRRTAEGPSFAFVSSRIEPGVWLADVSLAGNGKSYQIGPEKIVVPQTPAK